MKAIEERTLTGEKASGKRSNRKNLGGAYQEMQNVKWKSHRHRKRNGEKNDQKSL